MVAMTSTDNDARYAAFQAQIDAVQAAVLADTTPYEHLRQHLQPFWEHLRAGKTFRRKPSLGLRLLADDTSLLVGCSPWYDARAKTIWPAWLLLDMILEVERYLDEEDPTPFYKLQHSLSLMVKPGETSCRLISGHCPVAAVATLTTLIQHFLADPPGVLRRSLRHCSICGRPLTDGQSQARGIGPECLKHLSPLVGYRHSVLGLMETVADWEEGNAGGHGVLGFPHL